MKIFFMGTGIFASTILEGLINSKFKPISLITQSSKPTGRQHTVLPSPAKKIALAHNIEIHEPEKLSDEIAEYLKKSEIDLIIVADYGRIIPKKILEIPKFGVLNIHPSLLPKYRGPSPIQNAILNGDDTAGVTIMILDEKMDHGPIVSQEEIELKNDLTSPELSKKLAALGEKLLIKILPDFLKGKITAKEQNHEKATYTEIITKEDGRINWQNTAEEIEQQLRAYIEWPGSWTEWKNEKGDKKIKIFDVAIAKDNGKNPGLVYSVNGQLAVQCGFDSLVINQLQLEGKKEILGKEFLRGYPNIIGAILK
jgi:methionyl-tRNA formyltransferase